MSDDIAEGSSSRPRAMAQDQEDGPSPQADRDQLTIVRDQFTGIRPPEGVSFCPKDHLHIPCHRPVEDSYRN